ncbi:hypothetical protein ACNOYE_31125 [Nannocystaceae bacterium ST9]
MSNPLQASQFESAAMTAASKTLGSPVFATFVDFTTDLVQNVVQTVIQSSIDQLQAYSEIVAKVSGTLADYEQRTFPNIDGEAEKYMNGYIKPNFGDPSWTEDVTKNTNVQVGLAPNKTEEFKAMFSGLVVEFKITSEAAATKHIIDDIIIVSGDDRSVVPADLFHFARATIKRDIKSSYDQLLMILKLGMQKIVITDGKIYTKLTFHLSTTDTAEQQSIVTTTDYSYKSSNWNANLSGKLMKKAFGASAGFAYASSKAASTLEVSVVNAKTSSVSTMDIDIVGGVELKFRSDYFPSIDPSTIPLGG